MRYTSRLACEWSIESLVAMHSHCYLWTFTVPDVIDPRECARRWNTVQRKLVRKGFFGVRVFELHPNGHGLHVHAIANRRFDVNIVRPIVTAYGFGRIHVKRIPSDSAKYVAKYLQKQFVEDHPELKGLRLWAKVGTKNTDWKGNRVKDIECKSEEHSIFREYWESLHVEQKNFRNARKLFLLARLVSCRLCEVTHHWVSLPSPHESFRVTFIHPLTGVPFYSCHLFDGGF